MRALRFCLENSSFFCATPLASATTERARAPSANKQTNTTILSDIFLKLSRPNNRQPADLNNREQKKGLHGLGAKGTHTPEYETLLCHRILLFYCSLSLFSGSLFTIYRRRPRKLCFEHECCSLPTQLTPDNVAILMVLDAISNCLSLSSSTHAYSPCRTFMRMVILSMSN